MKRLTLRSLSFYLSLLVLSFWISPTRSAAQSQDSDTLVIEGGTLIDGNGGAPIRNATIVIQGNRIASVSSKGNVSYPPGAQVIRADGKFILPGYWEAETVGPMWYVGESELNYGVTSRSDIGNGGEIAMLQHEAINRGKINGPRLFSGIARIGPLSSDTQTGLETPLDPGRIPKSAEEAGEMAKRMLAAGADVIDLEGGAIPVDYYKAAIDVAHKAGKPVFVRPSGPVFNLGDAISLDADILSHSDGIPIAIAKDPSKFAHGVSVTGLEIGATPLATDELDVYADMDDAKAEDLIKQLVQHKISLEPTLIRKGKGFHKAAGHFLEQDHNWWLSNPNLRAYFPERMFESELLENTPDVLEPAERERRNRGYQNLLRFHADFVKAGGHLIAGCNSPFIAPPGLCIHQELEVFADAGLTPMQLIQAVTKWPAEAYRAVDKVGTIEAGKMADLVILNADPLQNYQNLKNIDSVIYNGKVQKLGYNADYPLRQPFKGGSLSDMNLIVEDLSWVSAFKKATFRERASVPATPPGGPVRVDAPAIEAISPYIVKQGSPTVTLTIKGFNFFEGCLVYFDNTIVPYRRVSPTELQVSLDPNLLQQAGVFEIFVKTPGPLINQQSWRAGDGTSNRARFLVDFNY